jgi:hypothetical protein
MTLAGCLTQQDHAKVGGPHPLPAGRAFMTFAFGWYGYPGTGSNALRSKSPMGSGADLLAYMAEREKLCRERATAAEDVETRLNWEDTADEWRALIEQVERQRENEGEFAPLVPNSLSTLH